MSRFKDKFGEQQIKDFLKSQEKELKANDLLKVYHRLETTKAVFLTQFFLDHGVDPLKYLSIIPSQYAYGLQKYYDKKIILPNNIEAIDLFSFGQTLAEEVYIPHKVYFIRGGAFESMPNLERLYIDGCPKIDKDAFYGCFELRDIRINCTEEEWYRQNPDFDVKKVNWPLVFRHASVYANIKFEK